MDFLCFKEIERPQRFSEFQYHSVSLENVSSQEPTKNQILSLKFSVKAQN